MRANFILLYGDIQFYQHLLLKTLSFSPLNGLCSHVENQLTIM